MKKRHTFFYRLLQPLVRLFVRIKFGYRCEAARNLPETYIVLSNHVTDWDPLFVGASFPRMMYFVGSEHIARWKVAYKFLKFGFDPIMRYKGTTAFSTVMEMLRRVKKGHSVCLFAEGVRSWDGSNSPVLSSTGKMVKSAKCGLVTYRIEGGYFVSPMWSNSMRKGPIRGGVVNVYTPEQLAAMTPAEVNDAIVRDLHEDAYERQQAAPARYKGKGLAEGMENFLFLCPHCGGMDTMTSHGDEVTCSACGHTFRYTEYGMLEGTEFDTVRALSLWQREQVARHAEENLPYTASHATLVRLEDHKTYPLDEGPVTMDGEHLVCGNTVIPMEKIGELAMHGKHAVVFSTQDVFYELIPTQGSNSLKFMLLFEAHKKSGVFSAAAMR